MNRLLGIPPKPRSLLADLVMNGGDQLLDEADNRLSDTHVLTGTYQIDKDLEWQDGPSDKLVGKEVFVRFLLEGDAQVFDVSFEGVDSLSEFPKKYTARLTFLGIVLPPRCRPPCNPGLLVTGVKNCAAIWLV